MDHKVYYMIKLDGDDQLTVLVLRPEDARVAEKLIGYESRREVEQDIRDRFGTNVERLSSSEFEMELASRQLHTPEVLAQLIAAGERLGQYLRQYIVYGSSNRPIDSIWARIPGAIYIQTTWNVTGYHTYVAVPDELSEEVVCRYELKFVSRPAPEIALVVLERWQKIKTIRVDWKTEATREATHFYFHPACYTSSQLPNQVVERITIHAVTNFYRCYACWQPLAVIEASPVEGVGLKMFSFQIMVKQQLIDLLSIEHTRALEALKQAMEHVRAPEYVQAHGANCAVTLLGFRTDEQATVRSYQPRCEVYGECGTMTKLVCHTQGEPHARVEFDGKPAWEARWYKVEQVNFFAPVQ